MRSAAEFKKILEMVYTQDPQRWCATVGTLMVEMAEVIEKLAVTNDKLVKGAFALAKEVKILREGAVPEAAADAPAWVPSEDVGADGAPLSPDQAAAKAQMDAALAADEAAKRAAPPAPQGRSRPPQAGKRPTLAPVPPQVRRPPQRPQGPPRVGADGQPLTPEQIAAEDAMDAATGGTGE